MQGYQFDSAVVATVLEMDPARVEERLDALERVYDFVRLAEEKEFPDRTLTLMYRFVHVLYQNALFGSVRATRKARLSAAVADALLGFYGERRREIASELAYLFEAARDYLRAAEFFRLAAQQAVQVYAAQEAVTLARRGLGLLEALPDTRERHQRELPLQVVLGSLLLTTRGYSVAEVESAYSRARTI
jgi:predicted ATPase